MDKQKLLILVGAMVSLTGVVYFSLIFNSTVLKSTTQIPVSTLPTKQPIPVLKKISWCNENSKKGLWISAEYFSGMNHAPTIQHICRGENELFYLSMDWNDNLSLHTGSLFAINSTSTFAISSVNKDPDLKLLETQNEQFPNQARISIDGKIVIFDEITNKFSN